MNGMSDYKTFVYFIIFFVIYSGVKDITSEEKIKEFQKTYHFSHSFLEYSARYNNIAGTVVAGLITTTIIYIPNFYYAPKVIGLSAVVASVLVTTKKLFNFPSAGWFGIKWDNGTTATPSKEKSTKETPSPIILEAPADKDPEALDA